jgi:two-component system cell cycle response regulator
MMPPPAEGATRVLLADADPTSAESTALALTGHLGEDAVHTAGDLRSLLRSDLRCCDLLIAQYHLPDAAGPELLEEVFLHRPDMPVVLLLPDQDLALAADVIKDGAQDVVVTAGPWRDQLALTIEKNLVVRRLKQDNNRLRAQLSTTLGKLNNTNRSLNVAIRQLEVAAATDPLTGLANRRALRDTMQRRFAECQRQDQDLSVIMIDLDGFKEVNDYIGHQQGDVTLVTAARTLEANCRQSDVAARFGGDEFVIVLPQTDATFAAQVAKRVAEQFAETTVRQIRSWGHDIRCTMSMGLATLRRSKAGTPEKLLQDADRALYDSKGSGKDRLSVAQRS